MCAYNVSYAHKLVKVNENAIVLPLFVSLKARFWVKRVITFVTCVKNF